ncbi:hypothetical protein PAHAL_3G193000 [Panicum hallii]|uniref:Uncharacterized protein n=1 Tax=Panicum hallii TaxID=206008 RepID=A0A2T8KIP5_9POAL|nr:hypothetical protein PAHAL_3G193000 [Panicum hallii]
MTQLQTWECHVGPSLLLHLPEVVLLLHGPRSSSWPFCSKVPTTVAGMAVNCIYPRF